MAEIVNAIDVAASLARTYARWLRFEEFPRFMDGVKEVRSLPGRRLLWRASIGSGGFEREWVAWITCRQLNRRLAWSSRVAPTHAIELEFEARPDGGCRLKLTLRYRRGSLLERSAGGEEALRAHVETTLRRFRELIEERPVPGRPAAARPGPMPGIRVHWAFWLRLETGNPIWGSARTPEQEHRRP